MNAIAIIPARMGSSRFPGKPLAGILGRPMVEHVYKRTAMCEALDEVYVATCDEDIRQAVTAFGGRVIMTSPKHERASDRVAEAVASLPEDIVVMVQGDEPMVHPEMIRLAIEPFTGDERIQCTNLVKAIETQEEFEDPDTIKVVMDRQHFALYFSREPIPTRKVLEFRNIPVYKQVCVIPFRRDFLLEFANLSPTPLEKAESIDMLRILEHGYSVKMVECDFPTHAVDTPEDLRKVEKLMANDPLLGRYSHQIKGKGSR